MTYILCAATSGEGSSRNLNLIFSFLSVDAKSQESATKTPCLADKASSSVLEGKKERKILHIYYCCCRSEAAAVILSHMAEGIGRILTVVIEGEGG